MPIDPSIPLHAFDVQPIDPVANYGRIQQVQQMAQQNRAGQMDLQARQIAMEDERRLKDAMRASIGPDGNFSFEMLRRNAAKSGVSPAAWANIEKSYSEAVEKLAKTRETDLKNLAQQNDVFRGYTTKIVMSSPELRPQLYKWAVEDATSKGLLKPGQVPAEYPGDAEFEAMHTSLALGSQLAKEADDKRQRDIGQQNADSQTMQAQTSAGRLAWDKGKAPDTVPTAEGVMQWDRPGQKWNKMGGLPRTAAGSGSGWGRGAVNSNDPKDIADAIARGDQPPTLQGLYRYGAPVRAELARRGYNLATAQNDWMSIQQHLKTMNGQQQERLRQAVSFAYDSLDQIEQLYGEWKKVAGVSGVKMFNKATLAASKQVPGKAGAIAANLEALINDFTSEMGTVYKGGNSSTDETLRLAAGNLKADWNEETFNRAIRQLRTSLGIRRNSYMTSQPVGVSADSPYIPQQNNNGGNQNGGDFWSQQQRIK